MNEKLREKVAIQLFKADCPDGEWGYAVEEQQLHKSDCPKCWQALKATVEKENEGE